MLLDLMQISLLIQTRTPFHWRKSYYGLWTLLVKNILMMDFFCLLQMLTDGLEWCGLLVDYCDVFISCLDSHSDGTHSLQSIHCWDTDAVTHFYKSDEETNSSGDVMWPQRHILPFETFIIAYCNLFLIIFDKITLWRSFLHIFNFCEWKK